MDKSKAANKDTTKGTSKRAGKKTTSGLAFIGGLAFASVAAGVVLTKNADIRAELAAQAKTLLATSRELLHKLRTTVARFNQLTGAPIIAKKNSTIVTPLNTPLPTPYTALWQEVEQQNAQHQDVLYTCNRT